MFGLSGEVLEWFQSYPEQLCQRVSVHGILFDVHFLLSGVQQGKLLGLLVFAMNTSPLWIFRSNMGLYITCMLMTHNCIYHCILTMS